MGWLINRQMDEPFYIYLSGITNTVTIWYCVFVCVWDGGVELKNSEKILLGFQFGTNSFGVWVLAIDTYYSM